MVCCNFLGIKSRCNYSWKSPVGFVVGGCLGRWEKIWGLKFWWSWRWFFFVQRFLVTWLEKLLGGMYRCCFASTWNSSSSFFFGNFLGAPGKKVLSWRHLSHPQDLFLLYHSWGGFGTMFASFCWENVRNIQRQRSKLWNYTLLFLSEKKWRLGSCFYVRCLFAWVFKKHTFYCEKVFIIQLLDGWLRIINTGKNHHVLYVKNTPPSIHHPTQRLFQHTFGKHP